VDWPACCGDRAGKGITNVVTARQNASLLIPVFVLAVLLVPLKHGVIDDTYIHIQYADNMITRGEYSFNVGYVAYGTTSPLWVLLLAALGSIFGGGEYLVACSRILSWLGGGVAVVVVFGLARAIGVAALTAWMCALTLATHAWHVRWTALSMETSSAVLVVAAAGIAWLGAPHSPRKAWLLGFAMAIAALVRPEAYLLVPVYVLSFLSIRRREWSCLVRTLAIYAALIAPWLAFAKLHLGQFLPLTAGAKSGGLSLNPIALVQRLEPVAKISGGTEGVLLLAILASIVVLRGRAKVLSDQCRFPLLWIVALPVAFVVFDVQILSRYLLLTTPFALVLGFVALEDLAGRLGRAASGRRALVTATAIIVVTLNIALYFGFVVGPSRAFSRDLTHNLKHLALHIKNHSDDDAVVAAIDIGYLGFYSKRRVLDLGGLVDTAAARVMRGHTYEEVVQQGLYLDLAAFPRVDFLIDRATAPNLLDGRVFGNHRLEAIRVEPMENLGIRMPGPYYFTLYRVHSD